VGATAGVLHRDGAARAERAAGHGNGGRRGRGRLGGRSLPATGRHERGQRGDGSGDTASRHHSSSVPHPRRPAAQSPRGPPWSTDTVTPWVAHRVCGWHRAGLPPRRHVRTVKPLALMVVGDALLAAHLTPRLASPHYSPIW